MLCSRPSTKSSQIILRTTRHLRTQFLQIAPTTRPNSSSSLRTTRQPFQEAATLCSPLTTHPLQAKPNMARTPRSPSRPATVRAIHPQLVSAHLSRRLTVQAALCLVQQSHLLLKPNPHTPQLSPLSRNRIAHMCQMCRNRESKLPTCQVYRNRRVPLTTQEAQCTRPRISRSDSLIMQEIS